MPAELLRGAFHLKGLFGSIRLKSRFGLSGAINRCRTLCVRFCSWSSGFEKGLSKMKLGRLVFAISLGAALSFATTYECTAQWKPLSQPGQKVIRGLGHGWSAGYHWRTPGHDSSYYNPYSHHNSSRITQDYGNRWNGYPVFHPSGVPYGYPSLPVPPIPYGGAQQPPQQSQQQRLQSQPLGDLSSRSILEEERGAGNGRQPSAGKPNGGRQNGNGIDPAMRDYQPSHSHRNSIEIPERMLPKRQSDPDAEWPLPLRDEG